MTEKRRQATEAGEAMAAVSFIFVAAVVVLLCVLILDKVYG